MQLRQAGKILSEVLPYMEVKKQEEAKQKVTVPNIVGMTIKEAKTALSEIGLELKLNVDSEDGIDKTKTVIKNQTPKQGITSSTGGYVMVDINQST